MNAQIEELIAKYEDEGFFTRVAPTEEIVAKAQSELELSIPEQFLDYLNIYSYGGINGVVILGIGLTGKNMFLEATIEYRSYGLPEKLIIIEKCDEWVYCLDCDIRHVVSWDPSGYLKDEYTCFDDFLLEEFTEAVDNL